VGGDDRAARRAWWWLAIPAGFLVLRLGLLRFSRALERRADAFAHAHADPASLARALELIYRASAAPPRLSNASHPDLAARQLEAGATPSVEAAGPLRPGPNPAAIAVLSGVVTFAALVARGALFLPEAGPWRARTLLALRSPEPFSLARLGEHELAFERPRAAHALFRAGARLEAANPWWTMRCGRAGCTPPRAPGPRAWAVRRAGGRRPSRP
jgi:hypothetical protein